MLAALLAGSQNSFLIRRSSKSPDPASPNCRHVDGASQYRAVPSLLLNATFGPVAVEPMPDFPCKFLRGKVILFLDVSQ